MARTVKEILEQHLEWWQGNGGVQLCWLGLLDEEKANLRSADLRSADLSYADLRYANLRYANLSSADLSSADLRYANLSYADLRYANLRYANLSYANLSSADLSSADLRSTQIDPTNAPNQQSDSFKEDAGEGWVYGYRTRETSAAGRELVDDRIYGCEVFSTCDTECHPGWYLWPTYESAKQWSRAETVRVKTRRIDIHQAGAKWRTRTIWVIGTVDN